MSLLDDARWDSKIYVNGWRDGRGGTADVTSPPRTRRWADRRRLRRGRARAAEEAAAAQKEWAALKPSERAAVLRRAGLLFEEHAEEIEDWIVRETGGIQPKAGLETQVAAAECFEASALPPPPPGRC